MRTVLALIGTWLAIVAAYRVTERDLRTVDVESVIRIPISLWNDGDLYLDEYRGVIPDVVIPTYNDRVISMFPIWPVIQLFPVYLAYGVRVGHFPDERNLYAVQRRVAQLSMATTTLLVGLFVARHHGLWIAVLTALAFGFGTINWFNLSRLSFSNGLVQLWLALALYCGYRRSPPSRALAAVSLAAMVVAVFYRLNLAPVAGLWALYLLYRLRRAALLPWLAAAVLAMIMAGCNFVYSGHPLGLYGALAKHLQFPSPTFGEALFGNLLSPARGLLVFSPWIAFAFIGLFRLHVTDRVFAWTLFGGCLSHYVVTSDHWHWYGGGSLGPRLTADVLPLWSALAAPGFAALANRRHWKWLPVTAVGLSVVIAGAHVSYDTSMWPGTPVPLSNATSDRLFDWNDALVLEPFRRKPYEERYPIRLKAPSAETSSTAPELSFKWESVPQAVHHVVKLAVWGQPGNPLVATLELEAPLGNELTIAASVLPPGYRPPTRLAWRVIALDERRTRLARSGWRLALWRPPPDQDNQEPGGSPDRGERTASQSERRAERVAHRPAVGTPLTTGS